MQRTDRSVGLRMLSSWPARCQPRNASVPTLDHNFSYEGSKLEVRSGARWMRGARRSGSGEQTFFHPMQAFPCRLGQCRVGAHNVADHLPGGKIERAFRGRTHRQRHRALRAEADALRRGLLARAYSYRLRKQVDRNRFLSGFEFPTAAKTIQVIQSPSPAKLKKTIAMPRP